MYKLAWIMRKYCIALIIACMCMGLVAGCVSTGSSGTDSARENKRFGRNQDADSVANARITRAVEKKEVPALVTHLSEDEKKTVTPEVDRAEDENPEILFEEFGQEPKVYKMKANDYVGVYLRGIPQPEQIEDVVDENGYITLPYIDRVLAAGKTSSELEQEIRNLYLDQRIYKDLTVNVVLPSQNYFIRGEVKRPGRFPLVAGVTVLQAVAAAGGYSEYANARKVKILRSGKYFTVDAKEIEKHPEKDIELEVGDVVIVPRSVF